MTIMCTTRSRRRSLECSQAVDLENLVSKQDESIKYPVFKRK